MYLMSKIIIVILTYTLAHKQFFVASEDDCPRNQTAVILENRECRTYCAEKLCRSRNAQCLCDGFCGKSCISKGQICPEPKSILHGKFNLSPSKGGFRSKLTYSCNEGYEIVGPEERICRGDEQWSGKDPFCTLRGVRCEAPPFKVANGDRNFFDRINFYLNETVTYKCGIGFLPSQDAVVNTQCQLESNDLMHGVWKPDITLSCNVKHCRLPSSIENGKYIPENSIFTFGMHIEYVCNPGYAVEGEEFSICLNDQTWSADPPYCEAIKCIDDVDEIPHGRVIKSGIVYRSFLTYECDESFLLEGEKHRRCSENGEWDGVTPTCKKINCGKPLSPTKGVIVHQSGTEWNDYIQYACNKGASTVNEYLMRAQCTVENNKAVWSIQPPVCYENCEKKQNNDMIYNYGYRQFKHDTGVTVQCRNGAEIFPFQGSKGSTYQNFQTTCKDGKWQPDLSCQPARCFCNDLPSIWLSRRKFVVENCLDVYLHNQQIDLKCQADYQYMRKHGTLQCIRGTWNYPTDPIVRCDKRQCNISNLHVMNGKLDARYNGKRISLANMLVLHTTVIKVTCNERYEMHVGETISTIPATFSCNDGDIEGAIPICQPARCKCSELKQTASSANIEVSGGRCREMEDHENSVSLKCKNGFSSLHELPSAECSFGIWRTINTVCHEKCSCKTFANDVRNPSITIPQAECEDDYEHHEKATLGCRSGYSAFTGPAEVICESGKWKANSAKCYADCMYSKEKFKNGYLEMQDDGLAMALLSSGTYISHNKAVILKCEAGFHISLGMDWLNLVCSDGKWIGFKTCSAIPERVEEPSTNLPSTITVPRESTILTVLTTEEEEVNFYSSTTENEVQDQLTVNMDASSISSLANDNFTISVSNTIDVTPSEFTTCDPFTDPQSRNCDRDDGVIFEYISEPSRETNCFVNHFDSLLADGHSIGQLQNFSHGSIIKFRCIDIVRFKFAGDSVLKCSNGKWNGTSPECFTLNERDYRKPPMIKYTVEVGESDIDDDGSLLISEGANLVLRCLWFKSYIQPQWLGFQITENIGPPVWNNNKNEFNLQIFNIQKDFPLNYTCSVSGKHNSFRLKIMPSLQSYSAVTASYFTVLEEQTPSNSKGMCRKKDTDNIATYNYDSFGIETRMSVPHGTRMDIQCQTGYEVLPTVTWEIKTTALSGCHDGKWTPHVYCSPARCLCAHIPTYFLERKLMVADRCSIGADHTTYIILSCKPGYQIRFSPSLVCQYGTWNTSQIQDMQCTRSNVQEGCVLDLSDKRHLMAFWNGMKYSKEISSRWNIEEGATLVLRCADPLMFQLNPPSRISVTCQQGSWTVRLPNCRPLGYNSPSLPLKIRVLESGQVERQYISIHPSFTDDGSLILPKWKGIMIFCTKDDYFNTELSIEEDILSHKSNLFFNKHNLKDGTYMIITPVKVKVTATLKCSYGKQDGQWHHPKIVFGDTCSPMDEARLPRNTQLVRGFRQTIYIEGDQIPLQCLSGVRPVGYYVKCYGTNGWGLVYQSSNAPSCQ